MMVKTENVIPIEDSADLDDDYQEYASGESLFLIKIKIANNLVYFKHLIFIT